MLGRRYCGMKQLKDFQRHAEIGREVKEWEERKDRRTREMEIHNIFFPVEQSKNKNKTENSLRKCKCKER